MMNRYSFYIDGANLFHVIDHYHAEYKWLDLFQMVRSVIPRSCVLETVYYFTSITEEITR